ncbi:MAG TPA: hypothetical protein VFS02_15025, partial [Telluria sp.]|nr:hypothetical protein [Telluria sp.]
KWRDPSIQVCLRRGVRSIAVAGHVPLFGELGESRDRADQQSRYDPHQVVTEGQSVEFEQAGSGRFQWSSSPSGSTSKQMLEVEVS